MGVANFSDTGKGETVEYAFDNARENAIWDYGHDSYNGTISTCDSVVDFTNDIPEDLSTPEKIAILELGVTGQYSGKVDPKYYELCSLVESTVEKWGPCAAVKIGEGQYFFSGLAAT